MSTTTEVSHVSQTAIEQVVIDRLASSHSFTVGTSGPEGRWVAGAFFVESDPFTLELVLEVAPSDVEHVLGN